MTNWRQRAKSTARIALLASLSSPILAQAEPEYRSASEWRAGASRSQVVEAKPNIIKLDSAPKKVVITSPIEEATLNPQIFIPPPKDLQLEEAGATKADAIARYVEGLALEEAGEPAKAIEAFLKSLQADPTNISLANHVAWTMARKGQIPEAIGILKDSAKALPNESAPQLALAYFYLRYLKKAETAESYAAKALTLNPSDPRPYAYLVEIYLIRGQEKKAEATLEKALSAKSKEPEFWVGLGDLYRRLLLPEGQQASEAAIKKISRFYEKAAQLDSENPRVLNQLANFYSLTNNLNKAIPLYLKVLELSPSNDDELLTAVRENLALSYIQNKQQDKAVELLEKEVKEHPQQRFAYELLGDLYESLNDYPNALRNYEKCLEMSSNSPKQYERVALLLLDKVNDPKRAAEVIGEARRQFPDMPYFTFLQALALRIEKRYDESMKIFAQAEKEAESNSNALLNDFFYYQYGMSAEMAGLHEKAATLFKKSIELNPSNPGPYNYLGYMWVDRNENLEEAGELIKRALELKPGEPAFMDSLGWYYYRIGNFERALAELLRACESLKEPDPIVLDHVADTYSKLGNETQAIAFWEQAVKLDPSNKKISEKLESAKKKVSDE